MVRPVNRANSLIASTGSIEGMLISLAVPVPVRLNATSSSSARKPAGMTVQPAPNRPWLRSANALKSQGCP